MSDLKDKDNIRIIYGESFYDVESTEHSFWSWSHEKTAELSVENVSNKKAIYTLSTTIFPAPKEESQIIKLRIGNQDEEVIIAPCNIVRSVDIGPKEKIVVNFTSEIESKEIIEDPRKFNFSVNNLKVVYRDIEEDMYVQWLNSEHTIGYYLENGFYEAEQNESIRWQWAYAGDAKLRIVNRLSKMAEFTLEMQLDSICDIQKGHILVGNSDKMEEIGLPGDYSRDVLLIPNEDYIIQFATDNASRCGVNGDYRLLNFCVRDIRIQYKAYVNKILWSKPDACVGIQLDDSFYGQEAANGNCWNWAHEQKASIKIYNSSSRVQNCFLQFELIQAPEEERRKIRVITNGEEDVYEAPDIYEKYLCLEPWESRSILLKGLGKSVRLAEGDTRTFNFCIQNINCIERMREPADGLKAVKAIQLDLLDIVEQCCDQCKIKYSLFYGAMLGAVRHRGIIPWDDDIDIALLRDDYDILIKYMEEHLEYPYAIQTTSNDGDCFYGGYAKLRNSDTTGIDVKNLCGKANKGIWIDIFPLDVLTLDEKKRCAQMRKIRYYQNLLFAKIYGYDMKRIVANISKPTVIKSMLCSVFYTHKGIADRLEKNLKLYNDEHSPYVTVMARYLSIDKQSYYHKEWFENTISVPFEEKDRNIPMAYRACLEIMYGSDYDVLPKRVARKPHHEAVYDAYIPYEEYTHHFVKKIKTSKNKATILCGKGAIFEKCVQANNKEAIYLVDMNKPEGGYFFNGHMVLPVNDLKKMSSESYQIVICDYNYADVEKILNEIGVNEYKIYCSMDVIKGNKAECKESEYSQEMNYLSVLDDIYVHQVIVKLSYGDGVSNDVMAIYELLRNNGINTDIYTFEVDDKVHCKDCRIIDETVNFESNDVIIYHLCTGTVINEWFPEWNGRKIVRYHNITPPEWFKNFDEDSYQFCREGLEEVKKLASSVDHCIPVSQFNQRALVELGYTCSMDVFPVIVPFEKYYSEFDKDILNQYANDGYTNIIFSGRIVPNKCQQDVINSFAYYQKEYNPKSRLFLVGGYSEDNEFFKSLLRRIEELKVENVIFTNHISKEALIAYYKLSNVFLCMSEHEGFCIPLVEAMLFNIPIVAYDSSAISETLGDSGIIVKDKDWSVIATEINRVVTDKVYRQDILMKQHKRLRFFDTDTLEKRFLKMLVSFITRDNC